MANRLILKEGGFTGTSSIPEGYKAISLNESGVPLFVDNLGNTQLLETTQVTYTIDLLETQTVDIYAPFNLKISNTEVIVGTASVQLEVQDSSYTLNNSIVKGNKITISSDSPSVINLSIDYE
jgi:hypothetical protein